MDVVNLISLLAMLGIIFVVAFFQFSIIVWTVLVGVFLIMLSILVPVSAITVIFWLGFLIVAGFANLRKFRQAYLLKPAIPLLQKQMPPISSTERDAIESGDTWWERDLFCGKPHWKKLFDIPKPTLSKEEQSFIDNQVETLCSMLDDWKILFKDRDLSPDVWAYLKKEKFFGMVIPKEYGGLEFSALAHSTIVMKIATRSLSAAVTTMVPNSLGPGELLLHYGTDEQKKYYLPRLAAGEEIPCFALTAPTAGSDAGAIPDTGIISKGQHDGKEVIGILVNWDKRYITLSPVATVLGLAFHLYDPEHLLGEVEDIGITLCLLPTSHPGVEHGHRHYPIWQAFMNGPTRGKDVFIPLDWVIGGPRMIGKGWRMLMESLSVGRSLSLPALSTGCCKLVYRFTGAYSRIRHQFNVPIAAFEGVEEGLASIAGHSYISEATRLMTAGAIDLKINPAIVSAIAKYHLTEISRQVIDQGMDIQAGHMIQIGPRNYLANAHVAIPISITVEGANILTRNLIIFGQGAIRCHPYLLKEVELISAKEVNIEELDKTLMSHIGFYVSNSLRSFAYGITGGIFIFGTIKNRRIKRWQRQLTRMSTVLALLSDTSLIILGGTLKRRERISARLGDILSQLYLASAVLKYFKDNGNPETDVDYVCWSLQQCLYKMQIAADEIFENFPHRFIGGLLRFLTFPFGRAYSAPKDNLSKKIVDAMLKPSDFRNRLTNYLYISNKTDDTGARLEKALTQIDEADLIWKKIQKAIKSGAIPERYSAQKRIEMAEQIKIITPDEARKMSAFEILKDEIIKVNEFSFDLEQVIA